MKRFIACLVLAATATAIVACSQTGAQDKSSSSPPAAKPAAGSKFGKSFTPVPAPANTSGSPVLRPSSSSPSKEVQTASGKLGVHVPHGLVTLIGDVKVPAAETGSLMEITVKEGDMVEIDQVLAVIDNRDTVAKRQMAQGELEVAAAQAESNAELEAAQKAADVAKAEWEQFEDIRRKNEGAVSLQELRRARFQWERALAQIKVAQTDRQVAQLTTVVKQAQLSATDNELERREIKSPLKGEVVEVYKKKGEWVQPGEAVMRIVSLDKLYVEGFVSADQATSGGLEGKKVTAKVFVFDQKSAKMIDHNVKGQIDYASPLVEGSGRGRQFRVRAEVDNTFADNKWIIQPGSMAEMTIEMTESAPIRATGSKANDNSRNDSTPVSTGRDDAKIESLKPVTPNSRKPEATKDAPRKPAGRPF